MILKYKTFKKASDLCKFVNEKVGAENVMSVSMYRVPAIYTTPSATWHFLYYKEEEE